MAEHEGVEFGELKGGDKFVIPHYPTSGDEEVIMVKLSEEFAERLTPRINTDTRDINIRISIHINAISLQWGNPHWIDNNEKIHTIAG